jgi:hypothetical protein
LLVAVKHKSFKMFAHQKTKWHCALMRAASPLLATRQVFVYGVRKSANTARKSACAT